MSHVVGKANPGYMGCCLEDLKETYWDTLGFLDLLEGEECLHIVRGSVRFSSQNDTLDTDRAQGRAVVASKSLYLRTHDGKDLYVRIQFNQMSRWVVKEEPRRGQVRVFLQCHGYWKLDRMGLIPDVFVPSSAHASMCVDVKERRKFQGVHSWYRALERLIVAQQRCGDEDTVEDLTRDVIDGFLKISRTKAMPLGNGGMKKERIQLECLQIIPFCEIAGDCVISDMDGVTFTPYCSDRDGLLHLAPGNVLSVRRRRYIIEDSACEIYFEKGNGCGVDSVFFVFENEAAAREVIARISPMASSPMYDLFTAQHLWRTHHMSNFDYLLYLNDLSGRSFKNIYQYPIFPWVLSDYSSSMLRLDDPRVYRDFKKPIAAMTDEKVFHSMEIFQALKDSGLEHPWMHGSHYSNPGVVVYFQVRKNPKLMLRLQGRKFDQPNRIFYDISASWKSLCLTSGNDVKEMIPEMYDPRHGSALLHNSIGVCLGCRSDGEAIGDVSLPAWATSVEDFLLKMNMALESDHVSRHLHSWIDLVFGVNSRGRNAEKHHNLFHYMTYDEVYVFYECLAAVYTCCRV